MIFKKNNYINFLKFASLRLTSHLWTVYWPQAPQLFSIKYNQTMPTIYYYTKRVQSLESEAGRHKRTPLSTLSPLPDYLVNCTKVTVRPPHVWKGSGGTKRSRVTKNPSAGADTEMDGPCYASLNKHKTGARRRITAASFRSRYLATGGRVDWFHTVSNLAFRK